MSKTIYDAKKNVLHIIKDKPVENISVVNEKEQNPLRGFMVVAVNTQEELEEFKAGNQNHLQLCPVMANNEDDAIRAVQQNGKIPLSVSNYEFLKLQTTLIEEYAKSQKIELLQLDLFTLKQ